ncbi:transposase family protein [Trichormus azollae]|uniref:transposase family protein n=1 Tax=Trichormus azollae TaxID=1164 RepID=UPI0005A21FF9|nr:transposase family protein [Trichormus azollae]
MRKIPTLEVLGLHFGIWKTEAKDTFHYWLEILPNVLLASLLKQLEKHDRDYAMAIELLTEFHLIVDSMEQPRARSSDNQEQKKYFSGKKKEAGHIL